MNASRLSLFGCKSFVDEQIHVAKQTFATYAQVYEPGEPWMPIDPEGTIGDADFRPYFLEAR